MNLLLDVGAPRSSWTYTVSEYLEYIPFIIIGILGLIGLYALYRVIKRKAMARVMYGKRGK